MRLRSSTVTWAAVAAWAVALGGCKRVEEPAGNARQQPSAPSAVSTGSSVSGGNVASPTGAAPGVSAPLVAPTQLLTLPSSAFQAALFADDDAIELLTSTAAYRFLPGKEPLTRSIDLGFAATVTRKNYVYWSQGALWSEPRRAPNGSGRVKLASLAEQPQRIVADIGADEFAWLSKSDGDRYTIAKLENRRVKTLYNSPGSIDALTMIGDALYFVERPEGASWRIARMKLSGGQAAFSADKSGRWPALLRGAKDVIYYDGARRGVFSLSPDLQHERVLAEDFICSPLAVSANVYCSTMEGIFELSAAGARRQVVPAPRQLITTLAANAARLVFVSDAGAQGKDQLAVYSVPLESAAGAPP